MQEELNDKKREEQEAAKLQRVENLPELSDEEVTVEVISDEL